MPCLTLIRLVSYMKKDYRAAEETHAEDPCEGRRPHPGQLPVRTHWISPTRVSGTEKAVEPGDDVIAAGGGMPHQRVDEALGAPEMRRRGRERAASDRLVSAPRESWAARPIISSCLTRSQQLSFSATGKTPMQEPLQRWVGGARSVEQP